VSSSAEKIRTVRVSTLDETSTPDKHPDFQRLVEPLFELVLRAEIQAEATTD
jgi:hypothetical protein